MTTEPMAYGPTGVTRFVQRALADAGNFRPEYLREHDWVVVPVESGLHFSEDDCRNISAAAKQSGTLSVCGVFMKDLSNVPGLIQIECTVKGLLTFSHQYGHFGYLLVPEQYKFAILCTLDDYYLVAGPWKFVQLAVGKAIPQAREDFEVFAGDYRSSESQRARLLAIAHRYS